MTDRTITVDVPIISTKLIFKFSNSVLLGDIIKEITKKVFEHPAFPPSCQSEQFCLEESIDKNDSPMGTIQLSNPLSCYPNSNFVFERPIIKISVKFEDNTTKHFEFDSHVTIAKIVENVKPDNNSNYEFRLIAQNSGQLSPDPGRINMGGRNSVSIRMNPHRTLRSYRIKPGDVFILQKAVTESGFWRNLTDGNEEIAVIIKIPEPINLSKALKIPVQSSIYDLKQAFIRKIYLPVPFFIYELLSEDEPVPDHVQIGLIPGKSPLRLTCRLKALRNQKVFGVDPEKLPMVVDRDNGIEVPEILVILKELLLVNQGIQVEGLFRRAGSEIEMKKLKKAIEEGPWSELKSKDVHSVATLIKRWFKELPKRILELAPGSVTLLQIAQDPNLKTNLQQLLSPLYARLLNWLFHLCLMVIQSYETTKMDPKNLAIVWGPAIVPENSGGITADFAATGHGIEIVESNLRCLAENNNTIIPQSPSMMGSQSRRLTNQRPPNSPHPEQRRLSKTDEVINYGRPATPPSPGIPTSPASSRRLQRSGTYTPNQIQQAIAPLSGRGVPRGLPPRGGSVRGRGVGRGFARGAPVQ